MVRKVRETRQTKKVEASPMEEEVVDYENVDLQLSEASEHSDASEASDIDGFQSNSEESQSDVEVDSDAEVEAEVTVKNGSHTIKKLDPKVQSANDKANAKKGPLQDLSNIIYISRLPQGFKERELSKYFSQFGDLKQVRLARNKKTGNSRHYGFIEFVNKEDAVVAQEAMDNYLILGHLLKVKVLPNGSTIDKLFRYKKKPFQKTKITKSSEILKAAATEKHEERLAKLKNAGIDFQW